MDKTRVKLAEQPLKLMVFFLVITLLLEGCNQGSEANTAENASPAKKILNNDSSEPGGSRILGGVAIQYVAPNPKIYRPAETARWAQAKELAKIREHAWRLWGGITERTGQRYPASDECSAQEDLAVWDTWYSERETFKRASKCGDLGSCREFHMPRQTGGQEVLSFNKYSLEFFNWVDENKFYAKQTFINLNRKMDEDKTPVGERIISKIPPTSATMLKPTFWVVKKDKPVMIPYWQGPHLDINGTLTPKRPVARTWTNFVLYDPTGTADPNGKYPVNILGPNGYEDRMVKPKKVVRPDDFYSIPLTASDVSYIKTGNVFTIGGLQPSELEPCDLALLVGMHVTTAEFRNWTWQTFWWTPYPEDNNQPTVKAPFTHFNVATTYYFLDEHNSPLIGFNPYLEPPIEGPIFMNPNDHGSHSNCMTCHHMAAYPTPNGDPSPANMLFGAYKATGIVTGKEQWFANRVKTRFMWGMEMEAQGQGRQNE